MRGRIVYTVSVPGTPAMPPSAATLAVGDTQTIDFNWWYTGIDPHHADERTMSRAASGVVEARLFFTSTSYKFEVTRVLESSVGNNEYAVLRALNDEVARGTLLTWYPDYTKRPTEYLSCVGSARINPTRIKQSMRWNFKFNFLVLPSVQAPSTVPAHVMS